MAFDAIGFAPGNSYEPPAPQPIPAGETGLPVRAGGEIALHDRIALTVGYAAFGIGMGAVTAMVVGGLKPEIVALIAAVPALVAVMIARTCVRLLHWSALPLLALVAGGAIWAIVATMMPSRATDFLPAIGVFALALPLTSAACCRAFPAAFAVSMLGLVLAAPVGAATMFSIFR